MHWKFEKILSLKFLHQKFFQEPPIDISAYLPEFSVKPSPATLIRFNRLGWAVKPQTGGIVVFAEKIVRANGESFFKKRPEINEVFSFYITLNQPSVLNETTPFVLRLPVDPSETQPAMPPQKPKVIPNESLPTYSGQSRLMYFDNLNPKAIELPDKTQSFQLTVSEFADKSEFASRAVTPYLLQMTSSDVKKVTASSIGPITGLPYSIEIKNNAQSVLLDWPEGAWRLQQEPTGKPETVFLTSRPLPSTVFGVVRIFNTESMPLNQPRNYQAVFASV